MRTVYSAIIAWKAGVPRMVTINMNPTKPLSISLFYSRLPRSVRGNRRTVSRWRVAISALCIVSSALLQGCRERHEYFYPSLADAARSGEITRGWMPDFLPASSRTIHIAYDPSSPRTWCTFEFSSDDSQRLRENLRSVTSLPPRVKRIGTPGPSWWPDFLKGDVDVTTIRGNGFASYIVTEPDVGANTLEVLFVIDWTKGRGYFYRTASG